MLTALQGVPLLFSVVFCIGFEHSARDRPKLLEYLGLSCLVHASPRTNQRTASPKGTGHHLEMRCP